METSLVPDAALLALVFCATGLCLALAGLAVWTTWRAMKMARHSLEVIVRHQDEGRRYYDKAVAEALVETGRHPELREASAAKKPAESPLAQAAGRLVDGMADEEIPV